MMDGQIDWQALPYIVEIIGSNNPEELIEDLITIREHMRKKANAKS